MSFFNLASYYSITILIFHPWLQGWLESVNVLNKASNFINVVNILNNWLISTGLSLSVVHAKAAWSFYKITRLQKAQYEGMKSRNYYMILLLSGSLVIALSRSVVDSTSVPNFYTPMIISSVLLLLTLIGCYMMIFKYPKALHNYQSRFGKYIPKRDEKEFLD
ncbi:MAG TPA: hypothetical protein VKZ62_00335, partial [Georgenia sp.]|nr:hypothetical protein [Georgenia sp.]